MNKPIINGIDVSECPLYDKNTGCIHTFNGECTKGSCAVYKWLLEYKRLQEENEKQKEQIKQLEDFIKSDGEIDYINHEYTYKLQQENEELKELIGKTRCNRLEMYESFETECNKYKQTLEEIREIILKSDPESACNISNIIIKKINEVLNDRD